MTFHIAISFLLVTVLCDVCIDNETCHVTEGPQSNTPVWSSELSGETTQGTLEGTTMPNDEGQTLFPPSGIESTTTSSTQSTVVIKAQPTLPTFIELNSNSSVCWCDIHLKQCDMNCCCDLDCTVVHKQVFTHCENNDDSYNPNSCYWPNTFFRHSTKMKTISNGMLCVVRENLQFSTKYKPKRPILSSEAFEAELGKRKTFGFDDRRVKSVLYVNNLYREGSGLWLINAGILEPFKLWTTLVGDRCLGKTSVRFLRDQTFSCFLPMKTKQCNNHLIKALRFVNAFFLISPSLLNDTSLEDSIKTCYSTKACLPFDVFICRNSPSRNDCTKHTSFDSISKEACTSSGAVISLQILHNGTEGIHKVGVSIRFTNTSELSTTVKYVWNDSNATNLPSFVRSGNPGYLHRRPILCGRKIEIVSNETANGKLDAIELPVDVSNWLSIMGHNRGECSSLNRIPVLFNENVRISCFFNIEKQYFGENGCMGLQQTILQYLIHDSSFNASSDTLNRYIGIYGNSKVETISDWLQVLVESFPALSSHVSFAVLKRGFICNGLLTSLYIDIVVTKFGSVFAPQSKIIGVFYRFGPAKSIAVRCLVKSCNSSEYNPRVLLSTVVNFIDVTEKPVREFAQPPSLEVKLPHDFFYPFFSGLCSSIFPNFYLCFILISMMCVLYD